MLYGWPMWTPSGTILCMSTIDGRVLALAREIRAEMITRDISQADLADNIGLGRSTLYRYLRGRRDMPVPVLIAIADVLRVPPHVLLDRAEERARWDSQ